MNFAKIKDLAKAVFKDWGEDKVPRLSAALAYYTIFSLGPLLLIATVIAGQFFSREGVKAQVVETVGSLVGSGGADAISKAIETAAKPGAGIIASIIGVVTLLFAASGVFGQLKDALNTIWEVKPKPGMGFMQIVRERFLSFTMVLGTGFLLLVSLVVSAVLSALGKFLSGTLPGGALLWNTVNYAVTLGIITLMFALLFKYVPDIKIGWKDVWVGAIITALLFVIGQLLLGLYLGSGSLGTSYGAGGSVIVILVWIYYSAIIFFTGAEITQAYARSLGTHVKPDENAVRLTDADRAKQGIPHKAGKAGSRRTIKTSPWFR